MNWGDLYGMLATACGYTWREIDEMTLPDVYELLDYWADHPPLHIMVAQFLGVKPSRRRIEAGARAAPESRKDKFRAFMQSLGVNIDAEVRRRVGQE